MGDDLTSVIIYLVLALVGVIASAYKKKNSNQQQQQPPKPRPGQVPRSFPADPAKDFGPELGPLMELFDIPKPAKSRDYESVEDGPSVEEGGMQVDSREASEELAGLKMSAESKPVDTPVSDVETFEEGQSDIQKMIARYNSLRKELQYDGSLGEDISSSEIVSVEAEEEARAIRNKNKEFFDGRKAIIYSEILKRREF
ncbi:MAG TPA: hypothetical protein VK179_00185 [Bacteroidales bacterium]|nr:hypothetical protein [Bacteroidales bacterium]